VLFGTIANVNALAQFTQLLLVSEPSSGKGSLSTSSAVMPFVS